MAYPLGQAFVGSISVQILIYYVLDSCDFGYPTNLLGVAMSRGIVSSLFG